MEIFSVRLLFEIEIERVFPNQFSEEMHMVHASDSSEAFLIAKTKGEADRESFINSSGRKVDWKFLGITEVKPVKFKGEMVHVCDRTIQPGNVRDFRNASLEKARKLNAHYLSAVKQ